MISSKWQICNCVELGCSQQTFEDVNKERKPGRVMSLKTFKKHAKQVEEMKFPDCNSHEVQSTSQQIVVGSLNH